MNRFASVAVGAVLIVACAATPGVQPREQGAASAAGPVAATPVTHALPIAVSLEFLELGDAGEVRRLFAPDGEPMEVNVKSSLLLDAKEIEFVPANWTSRIGSYGTGVDSFAVLLTAEQHQQLVSWAAQRPGSWLWLIVRDQALYKSTSGGIASLAMGPRVSAEPHLVIPIVQHGPELRDQLANLNR